MLTMMLLAQVAKAQPVLVAEGVGTVARVQDDARNLGTGVGLRLGQNVKLWFLDVVPEIGLGVWSCDTVTVLPRVGGRAHLGAVVEPGAYAHVGYLVGEQASVGWDAGLSLDLTALRGWEIGVQGGLQAFGTSPTVTVGAHIGAKLGKSRKEKREARRRR